MRTSEKNNLADIACPPERGRHDKGGRQRALVAAAISAFAERGFDGSTTREVAERAGCSEGLIHRYFGGKQGLLVAVLEQCADAVLNALPATHADLEEDIRAFVLAALDRMWNERDTMRVTVSRSLIDPRIGAEVGRLFCVAQGAALEERLEQHRAVGRVRGDADLTAVAQAVIGLAFNGFFAPAAFAMDREVVRASTIEAVRILAEGLAPASERTGSANG